jgi:hypothetical protein
LLQRFRDDLFHSGVTDLARCATAWRIDQPRQPFFGKASAPFADGVSSHVLLPGDVFVS